MKVEARKGARKGVESDGGACMVNCRDGNCDDG